MRFLDVSFVGGSFVEGCGGARITVETDFLCVGFGGGVRF